MDTYTIKEDTLSVHNPQSSTYHIARICHTLINSLLFFYIIDKVTESCPHLIPPFHGTIDQSYATATYSCFRSFSLVGDTTRKCKNRNWTGSEPICREGKYAVPLSITSLFIAPHEQRERGKVICVGVHIFMFIYLWTKKNLNRTLAIDSPLQTFVVGLLVELID